MPQQVTRCPNCQTRFHVTAAQLQVAKGIVRCGSCQEVFEATEHLLDPLQAKQRESDHSPLGVSESGLANSGLADSAEITPSTDTSTNGKISASQYDSQLTKIPAAQLGEPLPDPGALKQALLKSGTLKPSASHHESDSNAQKTIKQATTHAEGAINQEQTSPASATETQQYSARRLRYLATSRSVTRLPLRWPWFIASLLAILALLLQIHLFYFEQMIRLPHWRPYYQDLCQLMGCQLPSTQDVSLIKSQHLIVRPHPDFAEAMTIDALLVNQADWPQPFPNLLFEFRNNQGATIAARSFEPAEYLTAELQHRLAADSTPQPSVDSDITSNGALANHPNYLMPMAIPIQITLDIVSPGEVATAYELIPVSNRK